VPARGESDEKRLNDCREACRKLFEQYCTAKKRKYSRVEFTGVGGMLDYAPDPADEPIVSVRTPTRRRIVIETKQKFSQQDRCRYVLVKKADRWLIDSKAIWKGHWREAML